MSRKFPSTTQQIFIGGVSHNAVFVLSTAVFFLEVFLLLCSTFTAGHVEKVGE